MDATTTAAKAQSITSVFKALRPFSASMLLARRKDKAAEQKVQQNQQKQAVEMLDFTASSHSYHRKTNSDSSVSSTTDADHQDSGL